MKSWLYFTYGLGLRVCMQQFFSQLTLSAIFAQATEVCVGSTVD